jgi:two-component system sensor histidine kinase DegS
MRGQLEKLQSDQKNLERYSRLLERVLEMGQPEEVKPEAEVESEGETSSERVPTIVRVIEAQERERRRLARQMHDGPAQSLTNLVLQAEICERLFEVDQERARGELANLKTAATSTFQKVKNFISNLRPMMLDDLGLILTLRRYVDDFREENDAGINLTVTGRERRIANYKEVTIFRVIQELLNNAIDISQATNIQINLDMGDDQVRVAVEDNGSGFDQAELTGGTTAQEMGLDTLRERVEMLQGDFLVESDPGRGTRVVLEIPLP